MDCSTSLLCPWDSPGKNTGVGCYALLQGFFPTQGSNPSLLWVSSLAGWFFTTGATWEAQLTGSWAHREMRQELEAGREKMN